MLICPQCQFENSDANKFCQSCGTSLTYKPCYACGAQVTYDAINCPQCGALTGTVLRAIVTLTGPSGHPYIPPVSNEEADEEATMPLWSMPSQAELKSTPASAEGATATPIPVPPLSSHPLPSEYLDLQQRYLLLDSLEECDRTQSEFQGRVLDCRPLQISLLEAIQGQAFSENAPLIPPMAELYLELQPELGQTLPEICDAWVQDNRAVLLLEDRSNWPMLVDLWREEQLSPQQIVFLLFEMVKLWESLEPLHCRQSLLIQDNLRVDEDQVIGLQRLYIESLHTPLSLQDLGRLWKELFEQSQQTYIGSLVLLLQQLQDGEIEDLEALQAKLRAIAEELTREPEISPPDLEDEDDLQPATVPDANTVPDLEAAQMGLVSPIASNMPASAPTRFQTSSFMPEPKSDVLDDQPTVVLPMQLFSLDNAGFTDTGTQRNHNEDAFCIQTKIERVETKTGRTLYAKGLYILCDGMGGHAGGEVASALAVDTLRRYFQTQWFDNPHYQDCLPSEESVREAVRLANNAIYEVNQQQSRTGSGRMGTTLVLVLVQDTNVVVSHVGDSRLYMATRKQGLIPVTQDHDVGQREIQRGVDPNLAYTRPDAYQLTQALGPRSDEFVKPDVQFMELNEDVLLVLSSDGMTDNDLLEKNYSTHLAPLLSSRASLEKGASDLIELANQYNGHDNITVVLIRAKVRPNLDNLKD
ncbi:serine/threonine phosphatase [Geitlerinema calcuttense]|uniref:Serine/threonine phosphatase n=1 Tax=Geitlerinema calcuttense NRMC-F 0142 TaxID=2922238 RepID=A0ABT7LXC8_9CYAN|nr:MULTISPECIES: serine/threonine phosphatase [Cyanophyceae]MDI9635188.1 serine/threonine phosphatase [Geitlerinema splendidum]MDL5055853.1 serine/threonine phosphatase [Oscillatoria laete-virens NRMC-F 0139]MDL5056653.1 serine/threonine phosphatase [Geitlerinema calcuttense NRMC-F 0142]